MLLLIDADILIYRAITSAEQDVSFDPDYYLTMVNLADARDSFISQTEVIVSDTDGIPDYRLCLSDVVNWRKTILPTYKSNRKTKKPLGFHEFKQWVLERYADKIITKPTLEADDVIGILATKPGNDCLIWSLDKDLKTIPGHHWNKDGVITITEAEADWWHMRQTLTGDTVDGYPGCPGVGPVKAGQILNFKDGELTVWQRIVKAYEKAGLTEADALTQARVARICRWTDWNQDKQEVVLWTP
jgi:DNA polymerase-1